MTPITYREGDATEPQTDDCAVIVHVCNDVGKFGAGFAAAVARRYPTAKTRFIDWSQNGALTATPYRLGAAQWIAVGHDWRRDAAYWDRWVVNMVAQHGLRSQSNPVPLQIPALNEALGRVGDGIASTSHPSSVHMPRIGCGLAGGTWEDVEPLVAANLSERDIAVFVYDLA